MAAALMAWFTAPAPIACTSARLCSRTTPAIAPATAVERERAETLMMSTISFESFLNVAVIRAECLQWEPCLFRWRSKRCPSDVQAMSSHAREDKLNHCNDILL